MIYKKSKNEIISYLSDASNYIGFADELYIPENINDLITVTLKLYKENKKINIRASGTSTTGSSSPNGGAIISMEKINKIIDFDKVKKTITVEAGITLSELDNFLSKYSLKFPISPTEKTATIGGNISTCASGASTYKYGHISKYIREIELINVNNDNTLNRNIYIIDNNSNYELKNSVAYSLSFHNGFLFGSEGTLGIIYSVKLQLVESNLNSFIIFVPYSNNEEIILTLKKLKDNLNVESNYVEYFDRKSLEILKCNNIQIPEKAIAGLCFEQDYQNDFYDFLEIWDKEILCISSMKENSLFFIDQNKKNAFLNLRHKIPETINDKIRSYGFEKIATDTAVPSENFYQHFALINHITESYNIEHIIFGHIGNYHLHCNFIPKNNEERLLALSISEEIISNALTLNGTFSAEHGVGKLKKKYLAKMYDEKYLNSIKTIKEQHDPRLLFGPGNIF